MYSKNKITYTIIILIVFYLVNSGCQAVESEGYLGINITEDKEKPKVKIGVPDNNSTVEGTIQILVNASDITGINRLEMFVDENIVESQISGRTSEIYFNTLPLQGQHIIKLKAFDNFNNISESNSIQLNITNRVFTRFYNESNTGVPLKSIKQVIEKDGLLWFATAFGLIKYDGAVWIVYNTSNSNITNDNVLSLAADNEGKLFVGTSYGLCYLKDNVLYKPTWSPYEIKSIEVDSANIKWIGTGDFGLFKYNDTTFTHIYSSAWPYFPYYSDVLSIKRISRNRILVGTDWDGLYLFENNSWKEIGNSHGYTALCEDRNEKFWIGTGYGLGLLLYENGYYSEIPGKSKPQLMGLCDIQIDNDGNLWFIDGGSLASGNLIGNRLTKFNNKVWTTFTSDNSALPNRITCILADQNNSIWVCGEDGVAVAE